MHQKQSYERKVQQNLDYNDFQLNMKSSTISTNIYSKNDEKITKPD